MVLGAFLAKLGCTGVAVIPVMVLAGAGCGAINGLIVTKFKVSSFIATMSVGLTLSGITQALSGGGILNTNIPKILTSFSRGKVFWVGYSVILFFILCVIIRFMLNETEFGRHLYAVGISGRTAAYAGIKVGHVRLAAFTCAGLFCGIVAAVLLGQLGAASCPLPLAGSMCQDCWRDCSCVPWVRMGLRLQARPYGEVMFSRGVS